MPILVITTMEPNPKTGRMELVASHGVDLDTDRAVVLSCDHPQALGARVDPEMGEWVIPDPAPSVRA